MKKVSNLFLGVLLMTAGFIGTCFGETHRVFFDGLPFSVDSGGVVERNINGITRVAGRLQLKAVFHVDSGIGEFEKLRVELKKGSEAVITSNCYSIHAPVELTPKCDFTKIIGSSIIQIPGFWVLKVHNNGGKRIKDFDLEKGSFPNPLVPNFKSTYVEDCPSKSNLDMEGTTLSLNANGSAKRDLFGLIRHKGAIELDAKWHTATLIPNVFVKLKIELLKPNGTVAKSENIYSIHAPDDKRPKFGRNSMIYVLTEEDARLEGKWELRITNNSDERIEGFDIKKGSDGNPFVPQFKSTFTPRCN